MSKIFFYYPETDLYSFSESNKLFNPDNNNQKKMIDESVQTESKVNELDESPEKDYSFLKEQSKDYNNQYLSRKRK